MSWPVAGAIPGVERQPLKKLKADAEQLGVRAALVAARSDHRRRESCRRGGTIGSTFVAKADPDGYTMLVHGSALTISPSLYSNLGYDPARDFAAVVPLGITSSVLVVPPAKGWKTVGDLVAAAKAKPGALNFSSVGVGSATHLSAERFRTSAAVEAVHVPFKGGAEAMTEVIAGRIDFFFGPVALVLPQDSGGQACGARGERRQTLRCTARRADYAGSRLQPTPSIRSGWDCSCQRRPRATSSTSSIARRSKRCKEPKVRDKLAALGFDPMVMTPAEFDAHVEKEIAVNAALVKAASRRALTGMTSTD